MDTASSPPCPEKQTLPTERGLTGRSNAACLFDSCSGEKARMHCFTTAVHTVIVAGGAPALSKMGCMTTGFVVLSHR